MFANAVKNVKHSVKVWMLASKLESDPSMKKRVLWKGTIILHLLLFPCLIMIFRFRIGDDTEFRPSMEGGNSLRRRPQ